MKLLNLAFDRLLGLISRDISTDERLRRRFRRLYDIDVGLHTFWRFNSDQVSRGTRIGRYCSIPGSARVIDQNHPIDALSTHPLFYLKGFGLVDRDRLCPAPTTIEDDVWMGHASILTPGCKRVGRGAVIGAGAVVMRDVSPYAVIMGAPATLVRFRFTPELIALIEATRWWEMEPAALREAAKDNQAFLVSPTLETAHRFLQRRGLADHAAPEGRVIPDLPALDEPLLLAAFRQEVPSFTASMLDQPISQLGIDSFGLINLRLLLEQYGARRISDTDWGSMEVPRDLLIAAPADCATAVRPHTATVRECGVLASPLNNNVERRRYLLTMPRMMMSGLSESWLLKEACAIHWSNIARGLGTTTDAIVDDTGGRLYATVTRCRFEGSVPLSAFSENEKFGVELTATRSGAAMFFGDGELTSQSGRIRISLMTSFAKFGESGANVSLLKGHPVLAETCTIPSLSELPDLVGEYRLLRARTDPEPVFTVEYEVQPPHDINGIGLLYFAAYPIIADLCASKYASTRCMTEFATVRRDVSYFGNADPGETLVFNLLTWVEAADTLEFEASLARKSDGVRMALVTTSKVRRAASGPAARAG